MKKFKILSIVLLLIFAFVTAPAFANPVENFFTGLAKAVVSVPVHLLYTGPKHIVERTNEDGILGLVGGVGDYVGRPAVKVAEELGHAIALQATNKKVQDPGAWNDKIEEMPLAHALRNGAAAGVLVGVAATGSAVHVAQAGTWTGAGVAAGTAADNYVND